jgi:hypothetical protein
MRVGGSSRTSESCCKCFCELTSLIAGAQPLSHHHACDGVNCRAYYGNMVPAMPAIARFVACRLWHETIFFAILFRVGESCCVCVHVCGARRTRQHDGAAMEAMPQRRNAHNWNRHQARTDRILVSNNKLTLCPKKMVKFARI